MIFSVLYFFVSFSLYFANFESENVDYGLEKAIISPNFYNNGDEKMTENLGIFPEKLEKFFLSENGGHIILPFNFEPNTLLVILNENEEKIQIPRDITKNSHAYLVADIFVGKDAGSYLTAEKCDASECIFKKSNNWQNGEYMIATHSIKSVTEDENFVKIKWGDKNAKIPLVLTEYPMIEGVPTKK